MYIQHDSLEGLISITIAGLEQLGTPGVRQEHVLTLKKSEDLCTLYEIQEGAIKVALDNKSAAEQSAGDWLLHPWQKDYDMLLDIRSCLHELPIQVNF
jgi:hypothetical protein